VASPAAPAAPAEGDGGGGGGGGGGNAGVIVGVVVALLLAAACISFFACRKMKDNARGNNVVLRRGNTKHGRSTRTVGNPVMMQGSKRSKSGQRPSTRTAKTPASSSRRGNKHADSTHNMGGSEVYDQDFPSDGAYDQDFPSGVHSSGGEAGAYDHDFPSTADVDDGHYGTMQVPTRPRARGRLVWSK